MTTDAGVSHEQARALLHTGRRQLSGGQAKQLDAHLAACAKCRAYAAYLTNAEPKLAYALRSRWDAAQPALSEREFTARVRTRAGRGRPAERPGWLAAAPLLLGVVLLVLAAVWISSGWGLNTAGTQPTEVAVTATPLNPSPSILPGAVIFNGLVGEPNNVQWRLYALGAEGAAPMPLTPNTQPAVGAAWSPDGAWIAFLAAANDAVSVFVMRADGSEQRQVSPANESGWEYRLPLSWSPDGQWLAVARMRPGAQAVSVVYGEIVLIALDGSASLSFGPGISPKWSPDGARLAFLRPGQGNMTLFTAHPDGTDEHQASRLSLSARSAFDWLPDGSALTLIGLPESSLQPELHWVSPDGGSEQLLASLDAVANTSTQMHWSPLGTHLLFDAASTGAGGEQSGLYVYNRDTQRITLALAGAVGDFSWSPDSHQFVAGGPDHAAIYHFALTAEGAPLLAATLPVAGLGVLNPQWRPDSAALATALPSPIVPLPTAQLSPAATATADVPHDLLGRWMAFLLRNESNRDEIYLMREKPDGVAPIGFTGHDLAWSPDGTKLAFVSDTDGRPGVYLFAPEFFSATPLTLDDPTQPALDFSLAWSPDGAWLAVVAWPAERGPDWAGGDLYLLDLSSATDYFPAAAPRLARRVTGPVRWSPDGAWLAYTGLEANGLTALFALIVPADPAELDPAVDLPVQQLTAGADPNGPHDIYLGYAWSPDSSRVAYLRQGPWVGAGADSHIGEGFHASIATVSIVSPGSAPEVLLDLAPSPNGIMSLSWSPDGAYLLYLADEANGGCWNPYVLPSAGGSPLRLEGVCYLTRTALPQWSPDSRYLLLTTETGLAVVNVAKELDEPGHVTPVYLPLPADLPGLPHSPTWQAWP